MKISEKQYKDLCTLFASVHSTKEADLLIKDLFTPQEISAFSERWQIVQMLAKQIPQREIAKTLGTSISTITRGSRALQFGSNGFAYFLQKTQKRKKK